jgi:hypothetical protein
VRTFSFEIKSSSSLAPRKAQSAPDTLVCAAIPMTPEALRARIFHKPAKYDVPPKAVNTPKRRSKKLAGLRKGTPAERPAPNLVTQAADNSRPAWRLPDRSRGQSFRCIENGRMSYKGHSISATQLSGGNWVASFARIDGTPIIVGGVARLSMKTGSHATQLMAIADAQIEVDVLIARRANQVTR